ncbi:TonB-dependent receptor plug domain-containing protein [Aurantivibrio plasticivorans]
MSKLRQLSIAASCVFSSQAFGVLSDSSQPLYQLSLDELLTLPVVGATLSDETTLTAPAAVTAFSDADIAKLGVTYLHELLNLIPGFQSQRSAEFANMYSYASRGRRNGTFSKEVLLLVDGRIFNDPRSGASNGTLPIFPLEQVKRIEVIRGPGSALYGANAYTGVINIITHTEINKLGIEYGNQTQKLVALGGKRSGDIALNGYIGLDKKDGDVYNLQDSFSSSRVNSEDPYHAGHIDIGIDYLSTSLDVRYDFNHSKNFYLGGSLAEDINRVEFGQLHTRIKHAFDIKPDWESSIEFSYLKSGYTFDTQGSAPGAFSLISDPASDAALLAKGKIEGHRYRFLWHNTASWHSSNDLHFGVEWRHEDDTHARAHTNFNTAQLVAGDFPIDSYTGLDYVSPATLEQKSDILGVYGQYQLTLGKSTHTTLGLRYDDYDDAGSHTSPRIALVHLFNDKHAIKLLYGEAFRAPAKTETGFTQNQFITGNPELTHELVSTSDLIWISHWKHTFISAGIFYNRFEDPIRAGMLDGRRSFLQSGVEERRGIEAEIRQGVGQHWEALMSFTKLDTLDDAPDLQATQFGSLSLLFNYASWDASVSATYLGKRQMNIVGNDILDIDSHWAITSKLGLQFGQHWGFYVLAKNLTDEEYFSTFEGSRLSEGVPNRGRDWVLGATYTF